MKSNCCLLNRSVSETARGESRRMRNLDSATEYLPSFYLLLFWGEGQHAWDRSESSRAHSERHPSGFLSSCPGLPSGLPHQRDLVSKRQPAEESGPPALHVSGAQGPRIPLGARATWLPIRLLLGLHFLFSLSTLWLWGLYLRMREGRRNVARSLWTAVPFICRLRCEYAWLVMFTDLKSFEPHGSLVEGNVLGSHHWRIFLLIFFFPQKGLREHGAILKEDFPKKWVSNLLLIHFKAFENNFPMRP